MGEVCSRNINIWSLICIMEIYMKPAQKKGIYIGNLSWISVVNVSALFMSYIPMLLFSKDNCSHFYSDVSCLGLFCFVPGR